MFLLKLGSELQNLVKKFAVRYENINKLQTAFPSGMECTGVVFLKGGLIPQCTLCCLSLEDSFFTAYICFKETLFFSVSYKLFNKYFSVPQSTCQFRVSVGK